MVKEQAEMIIDEIMGRDDIYKLLRVLYPELPELRFITVGELMDMRRRIARILIEMGELLLLEGNTHV